MKTFQREFPERFHVNVRLDLGQDARRDEDLLVLCLATEARSEIGCRTDRAIVEPLLESDRADRGIAAGDADTETERMATLAPAQRAGQGSRMASAICTASSSWFSTGIGALKSTIIRLLRNARSCHRAR